MSVNYLTRTFKSAVGFNLRQQRDGAVAAEHIHNHRRHLSGTNANFVLMQLTIRQYWFAHPCTHKIGQPKLALWMTLRHYICMSVDYKWNLTLMDMGPMNRTLKMQSYNIILRLKISYSSCHERVTMIQNIHVIRENRAKT